MKIIGIARSIFQPRGNYLSPEGTENARMLLQLMNESTKYSFDAKKNGWQIDILSSLSEGKKAKFSDNRIYLSTEQNPKKNVKIPDCVFNIGKNKLLINSYTGEILSYEKGIFTRLKTLISISENYIAKFINNFDNAEIVTKNTFGIIQKK